MNILFLTLNTFDSLNKSTIYTDLLRKFRDMDNIIYVITPLEKKNQKETYTINENNTIILRLKVGNIFRTNIIEKGLSTILLEKQYKTAIDKYFGHIKFDLVLYSTPPITLVSAIEHVKKRDGAKAYLLLKDIFPQNAVDIGLMTTSGVRGIIYRYFRKKEKKLYRLSDTIGCMSPANVQYVLNHNPDIDPNKVEVCPNVIEIIDKSINDFTKINIRDKYGIPQDKKIFVYGGNLGRPQGIDFFIECLKSQKNNQDVFFFVVGDGTDYGKLEEYYKSCDQKNFKLMRRLPKDDYDNLVAACDVGLIFLDHRFTIPNFPSRLLGYMQAKLPILACTDSTTDIGNVITDGGFGWWCESNCVEDFDSLIAKATEADTRKLGEVAYHYLQDNYTVEKGYSIIKKRIG